MQVNNVGWCLVMDGSRSAWRRCDDLILARPTFGCPFDALDAFWEHRQCQEGGHMAPNNLMFSMV